MLILRNTRLVLLVRRSSHSQYSGVNLVSWSLKKTKKEMVYSVVIKDKHPMKGLKQNHVMTSPTILKIIAVQLLLEFSYLCMIFGWPGLTHTDCSDTSYYIQEYMAR